MLARPEGTRGRIFTFLRRSPATVSELASHLGVGYNAVRAHLTALERDGLVRGDQLRPGVTRPSVVYRVAPGVETRLSQAYPPFTGELVAVLGERYPEVELGEIMRTVGRRLAGHWPRPRGPLKERVMAASALLVELGAPNDVERVEEGWKIRGTGCLLSEAVRGRAAVCQALESLLSELLETPVRECCDRSGRPSCCFEVGYATA